MTFAKLIADLFERWNDVHVLYLTCLLGSWRNNGSWTIDRAKNGAGLCDQHKPHCPVGLTLLIMKFSSECRSNHSIEYIEYIDTIPHYSMICWQQAISDVVQFITKWVVHFPKVPLPSQILCMFYFVSYRWVYVEKTLKPVMRSPKWWPWWPLE